LSTKDRRYYLNKPSTKLGKVNEDESVFSAVKKMSDLGVGAIIVISKEERVIGIFTERDLMTKVVVPEKDPKAMPISEVMTRSFQVLSSDLPVLTAFQLMQSGGFRHVPIVDDSKLVGILSTKDLHRLVNDFLELVYDCVGWKKPYDLPPKKWTQRRVGDSMKASSSDGGVQWKAKASRKSVLTGILSSQQSRWSPRAVTGRPKWPGALESIPTRFTTGSGSSATMARRLSLARVI